MSGVSEVTKEYLDAIESTLVGKEEFYKGFVNYMNDSSVSTKYNYLKHICAFMEKKNKDLRKLTFDDFNDYIASVIYKNDGSKTSSSYQITIYSALKKFCEFLYNSGRISENYMLYVKRPKAKESQATIKKRENGYLTEKELRTFMLNVEMPTLSLKKIQSIEWDVRDKAIMLTFLSTGIRSSALRKLDVEDVNLINGTMTVTDKGDEVRTYEIPKILCDSISEWLKYRSNLMSGYNSNALFISLRRERMSSRAIYNLVVKYAECIPGKKITPHKLRATYGTQLYDKTGDIYFVQDCMGHKNPKTTELYVRGKKKNTKKAGDIMEGLL